MTHSQPFEQEPRQLSPETAQRENEPMRDSRLIQRGDSGVTVMPIENTRANGWHIRIRAVVPENYPSEKVDAFQLYTLPSWNALSLLDDRLGDCFLDPAPTQTFSLKANADRLAQGRSVGGTAIGIVITAIDSDKGRAVLEPAEGFTFVELNQSGFPIQIRKGFGM